MWNERYGARFSLTVVLTLMLASMASSTFAQAPSPDGALYFTNTVKADAPTGIKTFAMTDEAPAGTSPAKAYLQTSAVASTYQTQFEYQFKEPITLDGAFVVKTWISCDVAAAFRPAYQNAQNDLQAVRVEVYNGATLVGEAHHYNSYATCTGPTLVQAIDLTITLSAVEIAKNGILGVRPLLWATNPPEAQAKNVHFLVASTDRRSSISGPGLPGGEAGSEVAAGVFEYADKALEGTSAEIRESFTNVTNAVHNYTWTTHESSFVISATTQITNGSLYFEMRDGAGEIAHNGTRTSANNTSGDEFTPPVLVDASHGDWKIQITFTAFAGDASFTIGVAPKHASNRTTTNQTVDPAGADKGDGAPGLSFVLVVGALGVVTYARRRR